MTVNLDELLHNADWPKRTNDRPSGYLAVTAAGVYEETKHPRDPGGEGGGRWIAKGTTGVDEGTGEEKAPYATDAAKSGYLKTGLAFEKASKELLAPYRDGYGELVGGMSADEILKDALATRLLEKLDGDPSFNRMVGAFQEMPAWARWEREVTEFKRNVAYQEWMDEHGSNAGWNELNVPAPTTNQIGVAMAVGSWAATSSDSDIVSLSMQQAAIEEFGLEGISPTLQQNLLGRVDAKVVVGGRKFLRAQYDLTQEFFKSAGVTEVEGFRGVRFKNVKQPFKLGQQMAEITFNPLSSFSVHYDTALDFASRGGGEEATDAHLAQGALLAQSIPVSRILSTPFTGFGCYGEGEMVVLGDKSNAYVHAWQPSWYDAAAESWTDALGHPPATGDGFFLDWRDRRHPDAVG